MKKMVIQLAPSLISMCVCIMCLCGTSWAWFSEAQSGKVASVQTATYTTAVTVQRNGIDTEVVSQNGISTITLEGESVYQIKITADGTAVSGYCRLELDGETYFTQPIVSGSTFLLEIKANVDGVLTITPQWGTCSAAQGVLSSETILELGTSTQHMDNEKEQVTEPIYENENGEDRINNDEIKEGETNLGDTKKEEKTVSPDENVVDSSMDTATPETEQDIENTETAVNQD